GGSPGRRRGPRVAPRWYVSGRFLDIPYSEDLVAGVIYLLVVFGLLGTLIAFNRSRQRRTPPSKPAILPKPPPSEPRPDSPRINDEFLHKLYVLQARTMELPRPSTPDELLKITSFAELIEVLADPTVEVETLLRYFPGDAALLARAALNAR